LQIIVSDELSEIAILAAAIGRINNKDYTDLLQRLLDNMLASEMIYYRKLYTELTFSRPGRESCL
jgi:hypothetical protein